MGSAAPEGTVTFLFSDVEGSTRLLQRIGDRYPALLEQHRRLLRQAFAAHGGYEFGTDGDSFVVAFQDAGDALAAAVDAQRAMARHPWPRDAVMRVRMGLHTGEPQLVDGDYVGLDVHRAARVMAAGHGGQVLVSSATRRALRSEAALLDLGEHRLKDLLRPERLYQVVLDGRVETFPALRTLGARPTNLPVQPHALIGREAELTALRAMLLGDGHRLVTLVGPGGTGKTRLALQLAADLLEHFPSGAFFVPLATTRDPELLPVAIAEALAVREVPGEPLLETLVAYLRQRDLLLVVDNFEHVADAAPMLARLLAELPGLAMVVTSRERLRIAGERIVPVEPLTVPAAASDLGAIVRTPAAALFLERAQARDPGFSLTAANAAAVAGICRQLDGLPLALELAAGRIALLPPDVLLERLDARLDLLTGGARDAHERHRTLRATVAWSFELLPASEQDLFGRLSVFVGGCRLESAQAVCGGPGGEVLDRLESLLDKSLLRRRDDPDGRPRFWMLETIREFALERAEAGEASVELRDAHARHFLALAEHAGDRLRGAEQLTWLQRLEAEHPNLRAALTWALGGEDGARHGLGLRLAGALGRFWYLHAHAREGAAWLERALERNPGAPPAQRALALHGLGVLCDGLGDVERAGRLLDESIRLRRAAADEHGLAASLNSRGIVARDAGDSARARALLTECVEVRRRLSDRIGVSTATCCLGVVATDEGRLDEARTLFLESLAIDRELGDAGGVAVNLVNLGAVAVEAGDPVGAEALLTDALARSRELGDLDAVAECLEQLAAAAAQRGWHERAAGLAGSAARLRAEIAQPGTSGDRARLERHLRPAREALGDAGWMAAWTAGDPVEVVGGDAGPQRS